MSVDDSLYRGETDACTRELRRAVKALEGSKKTVRIALIKTGAVVPHEKGVLTILLALAEFDPGRWVGGSVFPRIAKQVFHCRLQKSRISDNVYAAFDDELYPPVRLRFLKVRGDRVRHRAQIEFFTAHRASVHAREIQHIVNQYRHALRRATHTLKMLLGSGIELAGIVFQQRLTETINTPEGSTQVMRDGIGK